jgi:hypothetical protein
MNPRTHPLPLLAAALALAVGTAARAAAELAYVDLQPKANQKLDTEFHGDENNGNHLGELPKGEQTLDGTKFKIGDGLIQLGSSRLPNMPQKMEIGVGRQCRTLHFLHATGWGQGTEADEFFVADGTAIGHYEVKYEGGTTEVIPIVYGEDVRDWWLPQGGKDTVTRGKIAWKGSNAATKQFNASLQLYHGAWKNPHPGKKIEAIVYSSNNTRAAPFLVALTCEG